jgi:hypothetical protein
MNAITVTTRTYRYGNANDGRQLVVPPHCGHKKRATQNRP